MSPVILLQTGYVTHLNYSLWGQGMPAVLLRVGEHGEWHYTVVPIELKTVQGTICTPCGSGIGGAGLCGDDQPWIGWIMQRSYSVRLIPVHELDCQLQVICPQSSA